MHKDSALRLQDKTIFLVGPFNGVTQAILRTMTEFGADIGYVHQKAPNAGKYIDGINEAREIHPEYGRAAYYDLPLSDEAQVLEALGRVAESLGRMDALVDATPLSWDQSTDPKGAIAHCLMLAEKLVPFLIAKRRGRVVYLFADPCVDILNTNPVPDACRKELVAGLEGLAQKYRAQNITVNALALGLTDDLLIKVSPGIPSLKKAFEALQAQHSGIKLVEFHDVGMGVTYLTSALSASVTGQVLRLTHGFHI